MYFRTNESNVKPWTPVYDDPVVVSTNVTTTPTSATDPPAGEVNAPTITDPVVSDPPVQGKFSDDQQKQVDKIVEKRVAKMKGEQQKTIDQLNAFKKSADITVGERDTLQERITSLEESMMTKEEIAVKNKKAADKLHRTEVKTLEAELITWKDRYSSETINRAILDAAASTSDDNPAINPSQIVTILRGNTNLVENTEDGKGTGEFVPRVKFAGRDSEGKPMQMDLTIPEAVIEMKKMENEYGNLWKSGLTGGVGSSNSPGTGAPGPASLQSQEAYMKDRQRIKETV